MTAPTLAPTLPRPRDVLGRFGIYVHVPFCSHRCWYCDFNAYAGLDDLAPAYMDALAADARRAASAGSGADLAQRPPVTSIFVGGGTPSLVEASSIAGVLDAIRDSWTVAPDAEITIECNPESIEAAKLDAYLEAGVNRVSIGVQSLDPVLLERLGRVHSADRAIAALELARERGFERVSADLIFGVPGETDRAWRASLDGVLATGVSHVSCYALIYEDGTPLESWRKLGKVIPVDDDVVASRWDLANDILGAAGFERYEISNWARRGDASDHNELYWATGEYLGIGAGAHSHLASARGAVRSSAQGAVRSWTVKAPERYIRAIAEGETTVAGAETIDATTRASEVMILGLRRTSGVGMQDFEALVGRPIDDVFGAELEEGVAKGLLAAGDERVVLTKPFLANAATVLFA